MPNASGSANDTLGRIVAAHLGEAVGQQIVIDNRAGAGGLLGMEIGKNSARDGYTLVAASTAAMSIAPHIHKKLPYDPLNDFEFISLYAATPNVLVVNPDVPSIMETVPTFNYSGWNGLLAPKGTPKAILTKLRLALIEVANKPQLKDQFTAQGAQVVTDTPEEFRKFVQQEIQNAGKVVRAAGLKVE